MNTDSPPRFVILSEAKDLRNSTAHSAFSLLERFQFSIRENPRKSVAKSL
jgi:hypothetical protein